MPDINRYCRNCGALLPENSIFCPNCGTPVSPGATPLQPPLTPREYRRQYRAQQRYHEKGEKSEKGGEKQEKGTGPGGGGTGPVIGGLVLVWLGISFYLSEAGYFVGNWWALFLVGLGAILIVQSALLSTRAGYLMIWPAIGGAILAVIGLAFFLPEQASTLWPLILVVIGAAIVLSAFVGRRRVPTP